MYVKVIRFTDTITNYVRNDNISLLMTFLHYHNYEKVTHILLTNMQYVDEQCQTSYMSIVN